jgi:hypothetical protein
VARRLRTPILLLLSAGFPRVIHAICDNAGAHKPDGSKVVLKYLVAWRHRVRVYNLPKYVPECNPVERVWWWLYEAITRNHWRRTMSAAAVKGSDGCTNSAGIPLLVSVCKWQLL